jgi:hypothetical protein
MISVPSRSTYGGFGSVDTIESIDAIADRDGSDDEILASIEESYKADYASSFPRGAGVRREGIYGYGGLAGLGSLYGNKSNGIRYFYPRGGVRGYGAYGADVTIPATVTTSLTMWLVGRAIGALCGYYIGKKLGPANSYAGLAGAGGTLFAGPLGLAAVAAYYAGKR